MPDVGTVLLLLAVAFLVCSWSGRTLAQHYQDRMEVVAILAVGVCVLGSLVISRAANGPDGGWSELLLALAMGVGLVVGYMRGGRRVL